MIREEILSVTESDTKGCEAINKLVHEKLGLCWHEWKDSGGGFPAKPVFQCLKCSAKCLDPDNQSYTPDYAHDIKSAWAIKEWLNKRGTETKHDFICALSWGRFRGHPCWASPLERCKAFLIMDAGA